MRVGLVDVDGGRSGFPNLALMKLSAWHKHRGDSVEWADPMFGKYDRVYMSKVFTFSEDNHDIWDCEVVKGGTGYDIASKLPDEVDAMSPDYSLYGIEGISYGFLTRGCPNKCPWCVVPIKEGKVSAYRDIDEVIGGNSRAVLMDNNILASEYGLEQLEKIADKGYRVDFNQGLDARLVTEDVAKVLARIKWIKYIRFACDTSSQIKWIESARELLAKYGYTKEIFVYCLIKDFDESYARISHFRKEKWFTPHCQPYRDFSDPKQVIPQWQKDMARWSNRRWLYKSCDFKDYEPRKGFKCSEYFSAVCEV